MTTPDLTLWAQAAEQPVRSRMLTNDISRILSNTVTMGGRDRHRVCQLAQPGLVAVQVINPGDWSVGQYASSLSH